MYWKTSLFFQFLQLLLLIMGITRTGKINVDVYTKDSRDEFINDVKMSELPRCVIDIVVFLSDA